MELYNIIVHKVQEISIPVHFPKLSWELNDTITWNDPGKTSERDF